MTKRAKLLVIGDGVVPTGISRITHNIIRNLPKELYEIHHLAVNYRGDPHEEFWKIYPAITGGDVYGLKRVKELVSLINPNIVLAVNDPWVIAEYLKVLKEFENKLKIVVYMAVDSGPIDPDWLKDYGCTNKFVVFTNFAKNEVLKASNFNEDKKLDVIPLGVDTEVFYPFIDILNKNGNIVETGVLRAKKTLKFYDNEDEYINSFVVLNANRNQPRKRIDITIEGFSIFSKEKPSNVNIYLHMGIEDFGWNILKLSKIFGIFDRLIFTNNPNSIPGISDEDLNTIFNACDVGINTSSCEGWGLPNFEHAAAGKAQVVPNCYSSAEIWNGCAEFLEPKMTLTFERSLTEQKIISPEDVAASLEKLYSNIEYRKKLSKLCYERVTRPEYNWKNIAGRWNKIFKEVLDSKGT